ncbi:MAG: hypothetical protein AB1482_10810 [Pseudomonadota bacterium]|jgi:hypothetical protein
MTTVPERGGATFQGVEMLLCVCPPPPIDEAIVATAAVLRVPLGPWLASTCPGIGLLFHARYYPRLNMQADPFTHATPYARIGGDTLRAPVGPTTFHRKAWPPHAAAAPPALCHRPQERDAWLLCMKPALDETMEDGALRTALHEQFVQLGEHMRNQPGTARPVSDAA